MNVNVLVSLHCTTKIREVLNNSLAALVFAFNLQTSLAVTFFNSRYFFDEFLIVKSTINTDIKMKKTGRD
jgi:hypothetical protein